jgi:hypothetical protein
MEVDEVQQLLEQRRAEHGEILAHPMMYVSALHNRQRYYPVNQDNGFYDNVRDSSVYSEFSSV